MRFNNPGSGALCLHRSKLSMGISRLVIEGPTLQLLQALLSVAETVVRQCSQSTACYLRSFSFAFTSYSKRPHLTRCRHFLDKTNWRCNDCWVDLLNVLLKHTCHSATSFMSPIFFLYPKRPGSMELLDKIASGHFSVGTVGVHGRRWMPQRLKSVSPTLNSAEKIYTNSIVEKTSGDFLFVLSATDWKLINLVSPKHDVFSCCISEDVNKSAVPNLFLYIFEIFHWNQHSEASPSFLLRADRHSAFKIRCSSFSLQNL